MKPFQYLIGLLLLAACNETNLETTAVKDSVVIIPRETVSPERQKPSTKAITSYYEGVADNAGNANEWKFGIGVYETKYTFQYLLKMQYKELRVTDTLKVPDLGFMPRVEVKKGKEAQSCIIGFYDKKGVFKEYKKLNVKNEQLKLTKLNSYYVASYRTKVN